MTYMRTVSTPVVHHSMTTTTTTTHTNHANARSSSYIQPQPSMLSHHGTVIDVRSASASVPPLQPVHVHSPASTQTTFDALEALKVAPPPPAQATSHTTVQVTSRAAAERQSAEALKAYDDKVNDLLKKNGVASGVCPEAFRWHPSKYGYNCGGGNHNVSLAEVEALLQSLRPFGPQVDLVNAVALITPRPQLDSSWRPQYAVIPGMRCLTPPPVAFEDPMHWDPVKRVSNDMDPVPKNYKGELYTKDEWLRAAEIAAQRQRQMRAAWARHAEARARRLRQYQGNWADPRYRW